MRLSRTLIAISFAAALLCLLTVGMAQAYEWVIKGSELSSLKTKVPTSNSGGSFELLVPAFSITIKCTSEKGTGELLEGAASTASITFSECSVVKAPCTVNSPEKSAGTLTATASTKFLMKEIGEFAKSYDEVTLAMTVLFSGGSCPLPKEMAMKGATAAAVPNMQESAIKRVRKFSKAIAEEAGITGLKLGAFQAFIVGEDTTVLTGAFENQDQPVFGMKFKPDTLTLVGTGAGNAKPVTIESISDVGIKIEKVEWTGAFSVTNNCDGKLLEVMPRNPCTVTVTCNTKPTSGELKVKWTLHGIPNPIYLIKMPLNCP